MPRVPDVRQRGDSDCGVAACAALLAALGVRRPYARLLALLNPSAECGTDPQSIVGLLRSEGLAVLSGQMRVRDLRHLTRSGVSVICLATLHGTGHYVVVERVTARRVYYQDPSAGKASLTTAQWRARWVALDRTGWPFTRFGIAAWR